MTLPLGFSDLLQDEALLVVLFREWMECIQKRAYLEEIYQEKLTGNQFGNILPLILVRFSQAQACEVGDSDLLSPDEEGVLTDVAIQLQRIFISNYTQRQPLLPNIRAAA